MEMPNCNSDTFQIYLNEFSKHNPDEFKIITLDNGAFHKAKSLIIPENIALIFLPPYSPELNPAENMWAIMKRKFTNKLHKTLEEVSLFITESVKKISAKEIKKHAHFHIFLIHLIGLFYKSNWYNMEYNNFILPSPNACLPPYHPNYRLGPLVGSLCDTLSVGLEEWQASQVLVFPNPT